MNSLMVKMGAIYVATIVLSVIFTAMMMVVMASPAMEATNQAYRDALPSAGGPWDNGIVLFGYILGGAIIFLTLFKVFKSNIKDILKALESFYILYCFFMVSFLTLQFLGADDATVIVGSLAFGIAVLIVKLFVIKKSNVYAIIISAMIGAIFGNMLTIESIMIFGFLMVAYDLIAVFVTKHMLTFMNEFSKYDSATMVTVTVDNYDPVKDVLPSGVKKDYSNAKRMDMGSGDLFMGAMLVSFAFPYGNMIYWAYAAAGIGFVLTEYTLMKLNRPIPALPTLTVPIMLAILGYHFFG